MQEIPCAALPPFPLARQLRARHSQVSAPARSAGTSMNVESGRRSFSAQGAGRILVVDDEAANRELLVRMLAGDGHQIYHASNGEEAIELVAREQPDLVLLDVMMPRMNGFEVCLELKRQASTRLIPVVLITAPQYAG